ncbi:MAG: glutamate--tRNA ligase [Holosporaceae bacterium]|jgi:glutamyl-tRNA synthetase|nr:glutamate--tRNA ligase [Holosporaceae bacterium]
MSGASHMSVRARFAPSPTGLLHVGNIKIALVNYLFAKKNGGKFILRIDDTDLERSTKEFENELFRDLEWLGIKADELYKQSGNCDRYNSAMDRLKKMGRVYACYETKEELSLKRKIQASSGSSPVYDRAALHLTSEEKEKLEREGMKPHWRFKLDDENCSEWNDLLHGKISIPLNTVSDPILVKPDGSFVYTFASVVDDINMKITHIIRGDDHITNTAVQMDIFRALSEETPYFAHIPLLSSANGEELSKRVGSSLSISSMRDSGMDPNAILNVLATLGTANNVSHRDKMDDLVKRFSFEKMSLSAPKFNLDDVKALTKKIISEKTFVEVKDELQKLNLENISEEFWDTIKGNLSSIKESIFWYDILFNKINVIKEDENFVKQMLQTLPNPVDFDEWMGNLKEISARKGRDLFHPIRIVLTGLEDGPELRKIVNFLGYERLKERIKRSLEPTS